MKKIIYSLVAFAVVMLSSCSNDAIDVEVNNNVNEVTATVSLSDFFSSYTYNDTKHDIKIADDFRTFNSEHGHYIQVRTLFYNNEGSLTNTVVTYSNTTNPSTVNVKLAPGTYTVVSTLTFADDNKGDNASYWTLQNEGKLATATLIASYRHYKWSIMSYDSKVINVMNGGKTTVTLTPKPVGALGYMFAQNFQYKNEATFGTVQDNGVRSIALYSNNVANGYRLDPNAVDKYTYLKDAGANNWYYLSDEMTPEDFSNSKDYGYFRTNLYNYFYILAPRPHVCFGYEKEGDTGFNESGENTVTIENGQVFLAYYDWFAVGNPYFGKADNNHWNDYSSNAKGIYPAQSYIEEVCGKELYK